jgi:hypothetical protein
MKCEIMQVKLTGSRADKYEKPLEKEMVFH